MLRHIQQDTYKTMLYLLMKSSLDTTCTSAVFLGHGFRALKAPFRVWCLLYTQDKETDKKKKITGRYLSRGSWQELLVSPIVFPISLHPLLQPVKTGVFIGLEGLKQEIKHFHFA